MGLWVPASLISVVMVVVLSNFSPQWLTWGRWRFLRLGEEALHGTVLSLQSFWHHSQLSSLVVFVLSFHLKSQKTKVQSQTYCGEGQTRVREVPFPRKLSFSSKRHRDEVVVAAP